MKKNPWPGKFIVFEGPEGVGKSTQAKLLFERIKNMGVPVDLTREPTDHDVFGKLVRFIYMCESLHEELPDRLRECIVDKEYLLIKAVMGGAAREHLHHFEHIAQELQNGDHRNLQKLIQLGMTFNRRNHRKDIEIPNLAKGVHEISDRDFLSTPAYAAADDLDWHELLDLQEIIVCEYFIVPDIIFYLDVPVALGLERTKKKQGGKTQYFDTPERMTKIRRAYGEIFRDPRIKKMVRIIAIDGSPPDPQGIHKQIWVSIKPFLDNLGMMAPGYSSAVEHQI